MITDTLYYNLCVLMIYVRLQIITLDKNKASGYFLNDAEYVSGSYTSYSHMDEEAEQNGHGAEARSSAQQFSYLHER